MGLPFVISIMVVCVAVAAWRVLIQRRKAKHGNHCRCGYDLTGNRSGRCPECGIGLEQEILEKLESRERWHHVTSVLMIVAGVPLLFVGGAVLAIILYRPVLYIAQWFQPGFIVPWTLLFLLLSFVSIPLLYLAERRYEGDDLSQRLDGVIPVAGLGHSLIGGMRSDLHILANVGQVAALIVELFLPGPRLLLGARNKLRSAERVARVDRHALLQATSQLLKSEGGIPIEKMLDENADENVRLGVLAYLAYYEWVGVSEDGIRVWLYSDAKRTLRGET